MIVVATTAGAAPAVGRRLTQLGLTDVRAVEPGGARCLVLARATDPWDAERAVADLRRDGLIAVDRPDSGPQLDRWNDDTRPVVIGDRLSVCLAWSEHERSSLPAVVELGLGGFGSGTHPTTRLLLDELVQRIAGSEQVLDVGCGSGVLGLAALRLGAAALVAVDVKPEAVEATRRNAELNAMAAQTHATLVPLAELDGPFDIVLANVARAAAVELAPELVRCLTPGGWLAISGITPSQCDQVAAFLRPLVEIARRQSSDWSALILTRH